ncbi:hypothetical protein E2P81_ATG06756 [Venturia nashicola]|uniref:Uncharacterized protein n=1 Tax=Venturia nashicola TaxID=86259 RepID=A0A4Z1NU28_9PEZI|nr:hypothetical protein E6O75_ATG06928 [Venturia nashicola]TLD30103.1 hypothetical protein E2P81_ATG06756 [Venturia nashicola]
MKLLPTMIAPLKTLMAFMTPLPPSSIVPPTPTGLALLNTLNTLPRKEVEVFWKAIIASGRSPIPMLFRPTPIWSHSLIPRVYAPTLTDTVLTKLLTPATPKPKPIPKPRTTFFSLPTELRQKILLMIFETHNLHYILHSPTSDVDFDPCFDKHTKKWLKAIGFLNALPKNLDVGMRFALWDDVIYVQRFWRDEITGLLKQSRELRGLKDPVEEADYESDESDQEEGRVYFDCVEGREGEGEGETCG